MKRPEITNLNHHTSFRRVVMGPGLDLKWPPGRWIAPAGTGAYELLHTALPPSIWAKADVPMA
jgi:hypothetical protein